MSALIGLGVTILSLTVYLLGWVAYTRRFLRERMTEQVCSGCGREPDSLGCWPAAECRHASDCMPRGAFRERTAEDVTQSMRLAVLWPVFAINALWRRMVGAMVGFVSVRTPLTEPERERLMAEQIRKIDEAMNIVDDVSKEMME